MAFSPLEHAAKAATAITDGNNLRVIIEIINDLVDYLDGRLPRWSIASMVDCLDCLDGREFSKIIDKSREFSMQLISIDYAIEIYSPVVDPILHAIELGAVGLADGPSFLLALPDGIIDIQF